MVSTQNCIIRSLKKLQAVRKAKNTAWGDARISQAVSFALHTAPAVSHGNASVPMAAAQLGKAAAQLGMSAPSRMHQFLVSKVLFEIETHIRANHRTCQAYPSPFDVRLFGDDTTIVQPDLLVICNKDILTDQGCSGAPEIHLNERFLFIILNTLKKQNGILTKVLSRQAYFRDYR